MTEKQSLNFLEQIIEEDLRTGKHAGRVATRFQPDIIGLRCCFFDFSGRISGVLPFVF